MLKAIFKYYSIYYLYIMSMVLYVNENKTKYMVMLRINLNKRPIQ